MILIIGLSPNHQKSIFYPLIPPSLETLSVGHGKSRTKEFKKKNEGKMGGLTVVIIAFWKE